MAAIYALTICLVLYAIGDIVSVKTKGLLSLVFVLCVVMLIGFWCGLPTDIVTTAGIAPLGKVSASLLVVGVGTTMNTKELIRQWKTVIASFCCCAAGVLLIVFVGRFIIGTDAAIAGAPIFAGASVALMIVNEALENAKEQAFKLGVSRGVDPFMTLSFMALTVIPTLRLTTRGVFDVINQRYV